MSTTHALSALEQRKKKSEHKDGDGAVRRKGKVDKRDECTLPPLSIDPRHLEAPARIRRDHRIESSLRLVYLSAVAGFYAGIDLQNKYIFGGNERSSLESDLSQDLAASSADPISSAITNPVEQAAYASLLDPIVGIFLVGWNVAKYLTIPTICAVAAGTASILTTSGINRVVREYNKPAAIPDSNHTPVSQAKKH